ncbi:MAG: hypothetical protein SFU27_00170, partial [Thermonemataceae bacterium]|nr:hypothetical protein [Thermonemataceae bacterium]
MKKIRIFALIMLVVSSFLAYLQFNTKTTKKVYANEFDYYLKFFQEKGNEKAKMKLLSKNISSKDIIANSPKLSQKYTKTYGYLSENYWDDITKITPARGATKEQFLYGVYAMQKAVDDKADLTVKKAPDLSSKEVSALEKYNKSEEDITENITLDNKENYERYRNGVLAFLKEMKINPFKTHGEKFEDRLVIDKT